MDNQRLLIWAFFGLMAWITYQTWVQDYGPKPTPRVAEQTPQTVEPGGEPGIDESLPEISDESASATTPTAPQDPPASVAKQQPSGIRVTTDVLDIEISSLGGTLQKAVLLKYPVAKDQPDTLIELLSTRQGETGLIESGIRATRGGAEATHLAAFSSRQASYELGDRDELVVPLTWSDDSGIVIEKRYRFRKGSYAIDLEQEVKNGTEALWSGAEYVRLKRHFAEQERSMFDVDSYSFAGPIIYNGEKSEKLKHDDLVEDGRVEFYSKQGWFGSIQHHFLSAVVPQAGVEHKYEVAVAGDVSISSAIGRSAETIAPGSSKTFETTLFVGPKLQSQLEKIDKTLKLTVDYGWLTIISQPLFWLLSKVHTFVGNWGVSIILVTFLIKLAFYKLTESSGRSMAKMRNLQPRMKALQDRYKDDRQALSQAMMELYKREKVNPAAGCLPILIQMPFFLAFYWVLLESVEMRQAPFMLWITDLSTRDPYFILPLIMGAAMFMQQKLNPAPADPVQAKVMQVMPVMFTVFFAFFPSGLVLYWVTNTLLSIAQQWKINTVVEAEAKAQKSSKKKKKDD
ncbi:MAG: membrane protein insertase YidC [Gammaproteobacteria bacterium]|nr:membrane protein insertase YidC [Gammaproteobacteria bacterium]MBT8110734.1 membrane protein insertase YidC [Gammaproteobacteria bacterium]NNL45433.1 membrane protein insertase YidC [Woeseiaceae bacterium]